MRICQLNVPDDNRASTPAWSLSPPRSDSRPIASRYRIYTRILSCALEVVNNNSLVLGFCVFSGWKLYPVNVSQCALGV